MSFLKEISQIAEGRVKELKAVVDLKTEKEALKTEIRKGFTEIGQFVINNLEYWHDSHPQVAIDFIKLREIIELKRVYNILKNQLNNEYLSDLQSKNTKDSPINITLEKFFKEKNREFDNYLSELEKEKEPLAENIGKFYLVQHLFANSLYLADKYRQLGVQIQELQVLHNKIDSYQKGKNPEKQQEEKIEKSIEKSVKQIIDDIWPAKEKLKVESTPKLEQLGNVEPLKKIDPPKNKVPEKVVREGLSLVERVRLLEDSFIYSKPAKAKEKSPVPENFKESWEWNDNLPWQKPLGVLGRIEVLRIENQRYLGWVAKERARKPEKLIDCRKCLFRKPFENKPEFYCSIIPNCNDQNAEGFRHGELAKTCNYYKPKRKKYKLHKVVSEYRK